jgi:hypothetical protein
MQEKSKRFVRAVVGLAAGLSSLVCVSCTSAGRPDAAAAPPDKDEAYFLIGVEPVDARIIVFQGDVQNGWFSSNPLANATFYGNPVDGFALGKTHAGNTLAITKVQLIAPDSAFFAATLVPCGGAKTIVFTAPMGKVIYVGSVDYELVATGQLVPRFHSDIQAAKAFLDKHYPQLAGLLEQGSYQLMPVESAGCR